jgi:hypothetical protein
MWTAALQHAAHTLTLWHARTRDLKGLKPGLKIFENEPIVFIEVDTKNAACAAL